MTRGMKVFLIASVLANLLLVGILFGQTVRNVVVRKSPDEVAATIGADKRSEFLAAVKQAQKNTADIRTTLTAERQKAFCILNTDPFDKKAYLAQLTQLHTLHWQLTQRVAQAVAALPATYKGNERTAFAELLRNPPMPMPEHPCQLQGK